MSDDEAPPPTFHNACTPLSLALATGYAHLQRSDQDDTIRILVATDNHIGYLERDPIRGQDSINTFKEILQLAVKHDVRTTLP
jgi:double-strand break repair protein MRE11